MGAEAPRSDASLHPLMRSHRRFLELSESAWRLVYSDAAGTETTIATGPLEPSTDTIDLELHWTGEDGTFRLNGKPMWQGSLVSGNGAVGLYMESFSHADVTRFSIHGSTEPAPVTLLYTEALLGAAQGFVHWEPVNSDAFRYGEGAISKSGASSAFVKWNFNGNAFSLWAPKSPRFGKAEVFLDGTLLTVLDFHAPEEVPSKPVFTRDALKNAYHALVLKPIGGGIIPVDCLEIIGRPEDIQTP